MRYKNCPGCGASNKESDVRCFSCDKPIDLAPPALKGAGPAASTAGPSDPTQPFKILVGVLLAATVLLLSIGRQHAEQATHDQIWMTDFKQAQQLSLDTGKPLLVNFTGSDWCGWCIKLKKEVFSKADFQSWASEEVILVELDFPRRKRISAELRVQNEGLAREYGIRGFPTVLLLDGKGKVLGKTGYVPGGPSAFIQSVPLKG